MSEAAIEEVSVLSSIYCREGEFQLIQQSDQDGLLVQINSSVGEESAVDVSLLFHLHPRYPSFAPDISISSTGLSRTQCHNIRQKLRDQAAALPPEPMVHQLVEYFQDMTRCYREGEKEEVKDEEKDKEWTMVLLLDHIRSQNHYIKLLERWTQQLQLTGRLLLGRSILVILLGTRPNIKGFCRLLKTVRVDVDSSGKKCKERMMKVLTETPSFSSFGNSLQGFVVKKYHSLPELAATFQEINMTEVYQHILPSLSD